MFENAKWIWKSENTQKDEYVVFTFDLDYAGQDALIRLSCDSDYNLLVNGNLAAFSHYQTYEYNAVYEETSFNKHLKAGKNEIKILVWHFGESNFTYVAGKAGLIFEVLYDGKQVIKSDKSVLSSYEPNYVSGKCKKITVQLGYSFEYDANKSGYDFSPSVEVEKPLPVGVRPVKHLVLGEGQKGKLHAQSGQTKYIYDFEKERVGFISFSLDCEEKTDITLSYGEHLVDGEVPRIISERDFSLVYHAKPGENDFYNAFRRLGCRYVAFESDKPFDVKKVEIIPTDYPITEVPFELENPIDKKIYDTGVYTLKMCMHEHYEDCPWREQALYVMDSRNQMLCGYYAFHEYDFAKASIALFVDAPRRGGLLPICVPCDYERTITSFSLHHFTQVREYMEYSKDLAFGQSVYDNLLSLLAEYDKRVKNGLILEFEGGEYWNFYEWKEGLDGDEYKTFYGDNGDDTPKNEYNLVLNVFYLKALQEMAKIAHILGKSDDFTARAESLKSKIYDYFYDEKQNLFVLGKQNPMITELGNYTALLTGVIQGERAKKVIKTLNEREDRVTLTLSMLCFKYDALLAVDKEYYKNEVLDDIRSRWGKMIDAGATTFWETEMGYADFDGAGSLCHGWSAIPVYYYHILLGNKI